MAPSYALVRRLGGEDKTTVRVEDLFLVTNYDLTKFVPRNSKSFSANNLYGLKKSDEKGIPKIMKCKILLLKDTEEEIKEAIKNGKLPRCEPARFESFVEHTEDLKLFEIKKEASSRSSSASKSKPTKNQSLSGNYIKKSTSLKKTPASSDKESKAAKVPESSSSSSDSKSSRKSSSSSNKTNDSKPSVSSVTSPIDCAAGNSSNSANGLKKSLSPSRLSDYSNASGSPPSKTNESQVPSPDLDSHVDSALRQYAIELTKSNNMRKKEDEMEDVNVPKQEQTSKKLKLDLNLSPETVSAEKNDIVVQVQAPPELKLDQNLSPETASEKNDIGAVQVQVPSEEKLSLEPCCCNSAALMKKMNETLEMVIEEMTRFKEMRQGLEKLFNDFKDRPLNVPTTSDQAGSTLVNLGGECLIDREWAEKKVWAQESLKWKLDKILLKLFPESTLIHFWFDSKCITEQADKIFPEECVDKLIEFFDETNLKRSRMEILKQQARARLQFAADKAMCDRVCEQIQNTITLQTESLAKSEVKKQIGKVLFDAKNRQRKVTNEPAKKPRVVVKVEPKD